MKKDKIVTLDENTPKKRGRKPKNIEQVVKNTEQQPKKRGRKLKNKEQDVTSEDIISPENDTTKQYDEDTVSDDFDVDILETDFEPSVEELNDEELIEDFSNINISDVYSEDDDMLTSHEYDQAVQSLIEQGKREGYIDYDSIINTMDSYDISKDKIEDMYDKFASFGIDIVDDIEKEGTPTEEDEKIAEEQIN